MGRSANKNMGHSEGRSFAGAEHTGAEAMSDDYDDYMDMLAADARRRKSNAWRGFGKALAGIGVAWVVLVLLSTLLPPMSELFK